MFIPTTRQECEALGWEKLDIVLVTGDSYVDSPFIGVSVIGQVLLKAGYRVGIIAQPDVQTAEIGRLGEPELFWGITGGSIDSMVANYTVTKKRKKTDDLTPGGENHRRPDRAVIVYANLIRRHFKNTRPIVLGGIEASLRRIAHYDYWSDSVRRSILLMPRQISWSTAWQKRPSSRWQSACGQARRSRTCGASAISPKKSQRARSSFPL